MEDWITADEWSKCAIGVPEAEYSDLPAYGGLDLAAVRDLTAFSLMWKLPNGCIKWRVWFWIPEETVEQRVKAENTMYRSWVDAGLIRTCPGNAQDHDMIAEQIVEICNSYNVQEVRFDRWGMVGAVKKLSDAGLPLKGHGQGFGGQSAPAKELERMVVNGQLDHEGNEVLSWMANNVKVIYNPAGDIKLDKSDKNSKIDGIMSGIMAMAAIIDSATPEPEIPENWTPFLI